MSTTAGIAGSLARVGLASLPTPLQRAPRLSDALGVEVLLKRDDLTGIGLGGNKVRGLEFLLGEGIARGCDVLVTGSGPQSNWAFLAALAARRCGMDAALCFYGDPPAQPRGNLMLQSLTGARIRYTGDRDRASVDPVLEDIATELRAEGRVPLVLPRGGATGLGSVGYVVGARETADQVAAEALPSPQFWLATGSCGTQAGLEVGAAEGWFAGVTGVTVSRSAQECVDRVHRLAHEAAGLTGLSGPDLAGIEVRDGWIGAGYGVASDAGRAAAALVAKTEGILLDPFFGAKAMAALVDEARHGSLAGPIVFLVSGGAPTIFAEGGGL
ncbi:MAG: pyridoxal-phosphate dependent enzyme [Candidatus Nanopelagicales bacterium]